MLVGSAAAAREPELLGYAGLLAVEVVLLAFVPGRERLRPARWRVWPPLAAAAAAAALPWSLYAARMFGRSRQNAGDTLGEITMGVDHHAVQGGLGVALVLLAVLAACWPQGRRWLGVSVGLAGGYVGLVSLAFPGAAAALGVPPASSGPRRACEAWGGSRSFVTAARAPR